VFLLIAIFQVRERRWQTILEMTVPKTLSFRIVIVESFFVAKWRLSTCLRHCFIRIVLWHRIILVFFLFCINWKALPTKEHNILESTDYHDRVNPRSFWFEYAQVIYAKISMFGMNYHHLESACETHKDSDQIFYPNRGLVNLLTKFWNHIIFPQFFLALESKVNDQYLGI